MFIIFIIIVIITPSCIQLHTTDIFWQCWVDRADHIAVKLVILTEHQVWATDFAFTTVVYYLPKVSGKSSWKVNESFQRNITLAAEVRSQYHELKNYL